MKIGCPKCEQEIEAVPEGEGRIQCPLCTHWFITPHGAALERGRQKLHNRADAFTAMAVFLYIFALVALGLSGTAQMGGDSPSLPLRFFLFFLGLGLALHGLVQLMHIRANTER